MVKKESLLYTLFIGLIIGFIGGVIFASYKLGSENVHFPTENQVSSNSGQTQLNTQAQEAISNLESEVTAHPENIEAWTRLGHLYYDTSQFKNAIKAYTKSLALNPGNADVWTDLGVMYRRDKQPEKAIEAFEHAYGVQEKHLPSRMNKGIVLLYDLNKPEEAITVWEEALQIDPNLQMNDSLGLQDAVDEVKKQLAGRKEKAE